MSTWKQILLSCVLLMFVAGVYAVGYSIYSWNAAQREAADIARRQRQERHARENRLKTLRAVIEANQIILRVDPSSQRAARARKDMDRLQQELAELKRER